MSSSSGVDHAVIGGVVAVIVFIMLCLLIVLGRYLIRHKGEITHITQAQDDDVIKGSLYMADKYFVYSEEL